MGAFCATLDREITREFNWNVDHIGNSTEYFVSDVFKLSNFEINTQWQIVLYIIDNNVFANLHNHKASEDIFHQISLTIFDKTLNCHGLFLNKNYIYIKLEQKKDLAHQASLKSVDPFSIIANYERFFNSESFSDFKFICSDLKEIPAHRFVLAAHSEVMEKMLTTSTTESKTQMALLEDIDSETMLEVLRFLYTGKVENVQNLGPKLLYCAEKYNLNNLKNAVGIQMTGCIDKDNVLEYLNLADRYNDVFLLEMCAYFIQRNYSSLRDHADWPKVNPKIQCLLSKIISPDEEENVVYVLKTSAKYAPNELPKEFERYPN